MVVSDPIDDSHTLAPYLNAYPEGVGLASGSHSNAPHHVDTSHQQFDSSSDAPLSALHPGMLGPQSPASYYSYPPTAPYMYSGHQAHPFPQERQTATPNNVDYTWQALMASIGIPGKPN